MLINICLTPVWFHFMQGVMDMGLYENKGPLIHPQIVGYSWIPLPQISETPEP